MKHKIVACIPTKDTGWLLENSLKYILTFCDKIIISDDNSSDNTQEICLSYDNVIYQKKELLWTFNRYILILQSC